MALQGIDLATLLERPLDHATYEGGYRSGYRDGWIACVEALSKALTPHVYTAAWDFWEHELLAWKFHRDATGHFPPDMEFTLGKSTPGSSIPVKLRFTVLKRDNYRCQLCGIAAADGPHIKLQVDHKLARRKGGTNDEKNLWTLCQPCNSGKGSDDL